jgi:hypothetical protein
MHHQVASTDLSTLRLLSCGGCPLAPAAVKRALSIFGVDLTCYALKSTSQKKYASAMIPYTRIPMPVPKPKTLNPNSCILNPKSYTLNLKP